jgi:hypothetical protein
MWPSEPPIRLLRYLLTVRVNSPLVRLPRYLPLELSLVLGAIIAERLPTQETRPWRKALVPWYEYQGDILSLPDSDASTQPHSKSSTIPDITWPIEVVFWAYPGKQVYGRGEPILWELKLLGESASHALFLELILPAIEQAGHTAEPHWKQAHRLWGNFDIDSVYAARGLQWEPLVQQGKLNLDYQPTATQWATGEIFATTPKHSLKQLTWLTPFAFPAPSEKKASTGKRRRRKQQKNQPLVPNISDILTALETRLQQLAPKKRASSYKADEIFAGTTPSWAEALEQASTLSIERRNLKKTPKHWPGDWIGWQRFSDIPSVVIPYLNLAAILHIGQYTHFGCGTFNLLAASAR